MEQLVVTRAWLYCSHSYMLKETEEGAIVALICERQPLLLHQLLDGDLMVRGEHAVHECPPSRRLWKANTTQMNCADGFPPEGL